MKNEAEAGLMTGWPELSTPGRLQQIIDIIAEDGAVDRDLIKPDATLETMGLVSMDVVMILMGVEDRLDIYLPMNNDLSSSRNIAEFVEAIDRLMNTSETEKSE